MDNKLVSLSPLAACDLPSLRFLDLSNNRLATLDSLAALVRVLFIAMNVCIKLTHL